MSVRQVAFDTVFDGTADLAPVAVLQFPMEHLLHQRHLRAEHGTDSLDDYVAVPMLLTGPDGETTRFALWRHRGNPPETFAVHLPLQHEHPAEALAAILAELGIPPASIVWRALEAPEPGFGRSRPHFGT